MKNSGKNVSVVKERLPGVFCTVKRFRRVSEAEKWLNTTRDQKAVRAGRYSIDAPEKG